MAGPRITEIVFRAGARDGEPPLVSPVSTVTVLVGPNGSGKSQALTDISNWCDGAEMPGSVVEAITAEWPTAEEARKLMQPYLVTHFPPGTSPPNPGWARYQMPTVPGPSSGDIAIGNFDQVFGQEGDSNVHLARSRRTDLLRFFRARLTGLERPGLASDQALGDLRHPANHLATLFTDDSLRARVRHLIHDAFGMYFTLDPTSSVGNVRMKLHRDVPPSDAVERGLGNESIVYHADGEFLTNQSDGVKAYTGLVAALLSLPHRVVLVDEPEVFLPPPLARRLGGVMGSLGIERDATVFAATHSAAFLMGCVESAADTTIVRLTFDRVSRAATARRLPTADLRPLMREPLLRSTGALEGLFHRAVVVTEADADRAFYDEINRRLNAVGRGVRDTLFLNAQNWSTEARIIGPLRRLGVPAAAILDIDVLWNPKQEWKSLYRSAGLREGDADWVTLEANRSAVASDKSDRSAAKAIGAAGLSTARRPVIDTAIAALRALGIFVVPVGELEQWLPEVGVSASGKHNWIVAMFDRLGSNPKAKSYVHPITGGVWDFIDSVEAWISDEKRGGMP